jgi:hypothetical protein
MAQVGEIALHYDIALARITLCNAYNAMHYDIALARITLCNAYNAM